MVVCLYCFSSQCLALGSALCFSALCWALLSSVIIKRQWKPRESMYTDLVQGKLINIHNSARFPTRQKAGRNLKPEHTQPREQLLFPLLVINVVITGKYPETNPWFIYVIIFIFFFVSFFLSGWHHIYSRASRLRQSLQVSPHPANMTFICVYPKLSDNSNC